MKRQPLKPVSKKRQVPWDFIEGGDDPAKYPRPNVPCEVGAAFGAELARFVDQEYAATGHDARCEDCAFRRGTPPNQSAVTLANAFKCVVEHEPFYCHIHEGRVCDGWRALREAGNT